MALTDDFNRASLGTGWAAGESTIWTIPSSTFAQPAAQYVTTSILRTEASFPAVQYSQVDTAFTNPASGDASSPGVLVRSNGSTTYYFAYVSSATGIAVIYKRSAGSNTFLADSGVAVMTVDTVATMKLTVEEVATVTTLKFYVDGVEKISTTNATSPILTGKPGLMCVTGQTSLFAHYDNFESTDASAGAAVTYPMLERNARGIERGILIGEVR